MQGMMRALENLLQEGMIPIGQMEEQFHHLRPSMFPPPL